MRVKKINVPIFFACLTMVQSSDFDKVWKKFKLPDTPDGGIAYCGRRGNSSYILILPEKVELSVIVHECVHLTNLLFVDTHINLDPNNDETQSYITEFFFSEILKFIKP